MNELKLFRTGRDNNICIWYWSNKPICSVCKELIFDFDAAFIVDWDKKKGRIDNLIHVNCMNKFVSSPLSVTQYRWNVLLTDVIPPVSTPIFIPSPSFSPSKGNVSVFETNKINSDKTKDNAWRSKRYPSIEGVVIGNQDVLEEIDMREKFIVTNPFAYLEEQKDLSKKAILEHNKIKQLEEGEKK